MTVSNNIFTGNNQRELLLRLFQIIFLYKSAYSTSSFESVFYTFVLVNCYNHNPVHYFILLYSDCFSSGATENLYKRVGDH